MITGITFWPNQIGKALSLALAQKGMFVTIIDFSEDKGKEVASLAEKESAKFHANLDFPLATFIKCDVTNSGEYKCVLNCTSNFVCSSDFRIKLGSKIKVLLFE